MMRHYKIIDSGGFVAGFGTNGATGTEITAEEFDALSAAFANRPAAPAGKSYVLRDNPREWVLVDAPPELEPEPTADEALTRYANELTGGNSENIQEATENLIKIVKED